MTPHLETSKDPLHWNNPNDFDLERHKQAPTSEQNDETRGKQIGLAQCPFKKEAFRVKDGRYVSITNSAFGAVYTRVDNKTYPVGTGRLCAIWLGYRRCAGEFFTLVSSRIS